MLVVGLVQKYYINDSISHRSLIVKDQKVPKIILERYKLYRANLSIIRQAKKRGRFQERPANRLEVRLVGGLQDTRQAFSTILP